MLTAGFPTCTLLAFPQGSNWRAVSNRRFHVKLTPMGFPALHWMQYKREPPHTDKGFKNFVRKKLISQEQIRVMIVYRRKSMNLK
ncbi:hypothetical protein Cal7507_5727 [Calothrix sp. PCC 7507]|nr:hypothetical protein Cal7507_5727 [Calothrix sp. PCC 7507]